MTGVVEEPVNGLFVLLQVGDRLFTVALAYHVDDLMLEDADQPGALGGPSRETVAGLEGR